MAGMTLSMLTAIAASEPPQLFGIHLIGLTAENGRKLLLSVGFVAAITLILALARRGLKRLTQSQERVAFWTQQVVRILGFVVLVLGLISIWGATPAVWRPGPVSSRLASRSRFNV